MKRSKLYLHTSNLESLIEDVGDDSIIVPNIKALVRLLLGQQDDVTTSKPILSKKSNTPEKSDEKVSETVSQDTEDLQETEDLTIDLDNTSPMQQLKAAYNILKNESKPGPTYLSKAAGIPIANAKSLYAKLKRKGKLGSKTTEPKVDKKPTLMDLINGLPDGSDLLVKSPFQYFLVLPEGVRAKYLTGLDLKDLVTSQAIATATKEGANKILVDEINELKGKKRPKVNHIITAINEKGNATGEKYKKYITHYVKTIPNGKALYEHMTAGGLNQTIFRDLKNIYKAVKAGHV